LNSRLVLFCGLVDPKQPEGTRVILIGYEVGLERLEPCVILSTAPDSPVIPDVDDREMHHQ
jgi:hypothetical protein